MKVFNVFRDVIRTESVRNDKRHRPTFDCSLNESGGDVIELPDDKVKDATDAENEKHEQKGRLEEKPEQTSELKDKEEQEGHVDVHTELHYDENKRRVIRVISI